MPRVDLCHTSLKPHTPRKSVTSIRKGHLIENGTKQCFETMNDDIKSTKHFRLAIEQFFAQKIIQH